MEKNQKQFGFSLIEILVGISLFVLIFSSIFGLIQLSFKMVGQSKARITATALANQKIETARNLPYGQVGTIGGIPSGTIPETATTTLNGVFYTVKTTVTYVDDPFDGLLQNDPGPWDYKRIKVNASWSGQMSGQVELMSDISPKGIENEADGGIISILVFDANGQPIPQASVHIENAPSIDAYYQTDNQGRLYLPGAPAGDNCYKITATKEGYSQDRTYATGEIINGAVLANPAKPYLSVIDGSMSEVSLAIDVLGSQTVQTINYVDEKNWNDSFDDLTKISELYQTIASTTTSDIKLDESSGQYYSSGFIVSTPITPADLDSWSRINWNYVATSSTQIKIHLLFATSTAWQLIPDDDLTIDNIKNSEGFTNGPIDLNGLDKNKYFSLKLSADLITDNASTTPILLDWQLAWLSNGSTPIANLPFTMQGAKILGTDSLDGPIYKYLSNLTTNSSGQILISDLEWDSYEIIVNSSSGYDLADSLPPQPIILNPNISQTATLKLAAHQNQTLLIIVKDAGNVPLPGATVRLYRLDYDKLKISSDSGQAFFSPLSLADYTLEIKLTGYQDWSDAVSVSGQTEQTIILTPP
ncbi:hypothetical protein KJ866_00455 [Patescibacteria group bacterium]|nr:hypothetical protein [Patescibacteria group bacterium]MBU2220109.1 hypothetical protein [Patescibacteria group bacterium]MBU2264759.1 hypothetical protein [Patescibacteria group bacterium]